jgi:hypothetical protein
MDSNLKISVSVFLLLILPIALFAQKDVTQFLGILVDGSKIDMIEQLESKGFTIHPNDKNVLVGEFNGMDVNIHIATNNNKVCRIMVCDVKTMTEADIRIRFNKLLQHFQNNKKYISLPDSTILKYTISDNENISYGLLIKKKQYEALFYQKTVDYDSYTLEKDSLLAKKPLNETDLKQLGILLTKTSDILNKCFQKAVWFRINEFQGKYYISMFYDNEYNRANGDDL